MKNQVVKHSTFAAVISLSLLASSPFSTVQAASKYWSYSTCGSYFWNFNCWSSTFGGAIDGTGQPIADDTVYLNNTSATDYTVTYYNTAYPSDVLYNLVISAMGSGNMTLSQGGYNLQTTFETIGQTNGSGVVDQYGGTHTVDSILLIGSGFDSTGTYFLSGTGSLTANIETIGRYGTGIFTQDGGSHSVGSNLTIGQYAGSDGTYNLNAGTLDVAGSINAISGLGSSTLNIDGGTLTVGGGNGSIDVDTLVLGKEVSASGEHTLSGTGSITTETQIIGSLGEGIFIQGGGTNTVAQNLILGHHAGGIGYYDMSSGDLSVATGNSYIGNSGTGYFSQSGGTHQTNSLILGNNGASAFGEYALSGTGSLSSDNVYVGDDGVGTFIQSGGTNTVANNLFIGSNAGSSGSYDLSAGDLTVTTGNSYVGRWGDGTFNQTGGVHTIANDLILAEQTGSTGVYTLAGGSLDVAGRISRGTGDSTLNIDGGTLTVSGGNGFIAVDSMVLGSEVSTLGSHTLSGIGDITANTLSIGSNGEGVFTQTGPSNLRSANLIVGHFATGTGSYDMSGGNISSVINSYIGLSGSGTFTQSGGTHQTQTLTLGYNAGSTGIYTLSGTAELLSDNALIGRDGEGHFLQTGGTNTVSGILNLGADLTGQGTYSLQGGILSSGSAYIGNNGNAIFEQYGGTTHTVTNDLYLGSNVNSSGIYTVGGDLIIGNDLQVGQAGQGNVIHSGGSTTVGGYLNLGDTSDGFGGYDLSSGNLTVNGGISYIANWGSGLFVQSGGTHHTSDLLVANMAGSTGIYDLSGTGQLNTDNSSVGNHGNGTFTQSGGTHTVLNNFFLGREAGSSGSYELIAGDLVVTGASSWLGSAGDGQFIHSGGRYQARNLNIGGEAGSTGNYLLSDTGELSTTGVLYVGGPLGDGLFTQTGGTNTVGTTLRLGSSLGATGSYYLNGGVLDVGNEILGYAGGSLNIDGGTLTVNGGNGAIDIETLILGSEVVSSGNHVLSGTGSITTWNTMIGRFGTGDFTQNGGVLTTSHESIGAESGSDGAFTQTGGTNTVLINLNLGYQSGSVGTYNLSGGNLLASSEYIARLGTAVFNQSGGDNTVTNNIYIANDAGSNGTYTLSGGSLNVGGNVVDGAGTSTLNLDGGIIAVAGGSIDIDTLVLGSELAALGAHTLSGSDIISAGTEIIGDIGSGDFIQTGGTNTVAGTLTLGQNTGSDGSYALTGTGVVTATQENIGDDGYGSFNQSGGTNNVTGSLVLGGNNSGNGSYQLSAGDLNVNDQRIGYRGTGDFTQSGGNNNVATTLNIGQLGDGTYSQTGGNNDVTGNLQLASTSGSSATYNLAGGVLDIGGAIVDGGGSSTLNMHGGTLNVVGDIEVDYFNIGGLPGTVISYVNAGDEHLVVNNALTNYGNFTNDGLVTTSGSGLINYGVLDGSGTFAGSRGVVNYGQFNISSAAVLGGTGTHSNYGNLNAASNGQLWIDTATLSNQGTLNLNNALVLGSGTLSNSYGGTITGNGAITTTFDNAGGVLLVESGTTNISQSFNNSGIVQLTSFSANLSGGTINNTGTIEGYGHVGNNLNNTGTVESISGTLSLSGAVNNSVGGLMTAGNGSKLLLSTGMSTNAGTINLNGGTFDNNNHAMTNTGQISGDGVLRTGGLTNEGNVGLDGTTDIIGDVNNIAAGTIIVTGASTATFHDDVTHNGADIRVSDGSQAIFFGTVSGSGSYTGSGTIFFEGAVLPGNSPGLMSVESDLYFGANSNTFMELGGLSRGDEYDAFDIGGDLFLDGDLEVGLYDLGSGIFDPQLGDSFDLFSAENIFGSFDLLTLAILGEGLDWQLDYLSDEIGSLDIARLSVVSASTVPVPAAVWLFASGLLGLVAVARRKKQS